MNVDVGRVVCVCAIQLRARSGVEIENVVEILQVFRTRSGVTWYLVCVEEQNNYQTEAGKMMLWF